MSDHSEKIKRGIALAKEHGRKVGRPSKQDAVRENVLCLEAQGMLTVDIAKEVGVSVSTVHRIMRSERESIAKGQER
jgi:DNA invertase Pin-like site-specific DNA recombinase